MRPWKPASILCLLLVVTPPVAGNTAQFDMSEAAVVGTFERAVHDYMALRTAATSSLPPLESSLDMGKIWAAIDARADAVRAARPLARAGELFTPAVGVLFRQRILTALGEYGIPESEVLSEGEDGDGDEPVPLAVVNGHFPWERAGRMLSCVLLTLPVLPAGLEYRFIGTSLVLVDVDASLVVDILPDVLRESLRA
jgi:hypothetical protein